MGTNSERICTLAYADGGMVFADAKKSKVIDQAKEKAEQKTGLEPISDKELAADKVERIDPPKGQ